MMDSLNHPLTVFGNIENTLWFSEPFSCGAGYGNFGSGWFFLKGILDLEAVGVRNGWQSNLRLFFLVRLARACRGGGGSMLQSGTKEMFSNVTQTTKLMSINRVEKDYVGTLVKK